MGQGFVLLKMICSSKRIVLEIIDSMYLFQVDIDQKSLFTVGGQENLSAVGAHAALLSAAKAGSGYSAFV